LTAKGSEVQKIEQSYFDSEPYDLDLEDSDPISSLDALALMMYHHTKYGSKGFGGTEDVVWTK